MSGTGWMQQGMGSVRLDLVKDVQDLRELHSQWGFGYNGLAPLK